MGTRKMKLMKAIQEVMDMKQEEALPTPTKGFNSTSKKMSKSQKKKAKKSQALALLHDEMSKKQSQVETVVFDNPDATWKKSGLNLGQRSKSRGASSTDPNATPGVEIDLKKTRYEIMKFGISGMSHAEKADAETTLAISLGAIPEKKPYVNYKELMETRKKEVEEKLVLEAAMVKPKLKVNKKTTTSKKAKALSSNDIIVKSNRIKSKNIAKNSGRPSFGPGKRPDKRNRAASRT